MKSATPLLHVLVTGGRGFNDYKRVERELDRLAEEFPERRPLILQGGATGADNMARTYACARHLPHLTMPAEWDALGPSAGPIRNQQMIDLGLRIDLVLAFPGDDGTADMVSRARKAGLDVREIPKDEKSFRKFGEPVWSPAAAEDDDDLIGDEPAGMLDRRSGLGADIDDEDLVG